MNNKDLIAIRLNAELLDWLKQKAKNNSSTVSNVIKEAIAMYKNLDDLPEELRFSKAFSAQADKTSILIYRLIESFIRHTNSDATDIVNTALEVARKDLAGFKVNSSGS